ncbi:MarR family winged helix-turn-helix transcriptional regulator [Mariniluteicoccus flavus]
MEDAVDRLLAQWARERPDLDTSPMGLIGRVHRLGDLLERELRPVFADAGLGNGEFDVLATLRRMGPPHRATPTELGAQMMVTSGAVTKRIDRLVSAGLVGRETCATDGRGREISLTDAGLRLIDDLVARHVANEERLLAGLSADDREALAAILRRWLVSLEE